MPVAKESFHAWQNLASAMYDKDRWDSYLPHYDVFSSDVRHCDADFWVCKGAVCAGSLCFCLEDREISDGATREFMLAEAALKDDCWAVTVVCCRMPSSAVVCCQ